MSDNENNEPRGAAADDLGRHDAGVGGTHDDDQMPGGEAGAGEGTSMPTGEDSSADAPADAQGDAQGESQPAVPMGSGSASPEDAEARRHAGFDTEFVSVDRPDGGVDRVPIDEAEQRADDPDSIHRDAEASRPLVSEGEPSDQGGSDGPMQGDESSARSGDDVSGAAGAVAESDPAHQKDDVDTGQQTDSQVDFDQPAEDNRGQSESYQRSAGSEQDRPGGQGVS